MKILDLSPGPRRTAELACWVQGVERAAGQEVPVLVGGSAVEVYTGGAYVSGDLDFVGTPSQALEHALRAAGFERSGRHWVHEEKKLFLEFPSAALESQTAVELRVGGLVIVVLSPEDLVVDRLAGSHFWGSEIDFENARLLLQRLGDEIDGDRLRRRAREAGVGASLRRLLAEVDPR